MEDKDIEFLTEIIHKICDYAVETGCEPDEALETMADNIKGLLSISTFNHWKKDGTVAENATTTKQI